MARNKDRRTARGDRRTLNAEVAARLGGRPRAIHHVRGLGGRIDATLLAALGGDGTVRVGWAVCNRKERDTFSRPTAFLTALGRALDLPQVERHLESVSASGKPWLWDWEAFRPDGEGEDVPNRPALVPHVVRKAMPEFLDRVKRWLPRQGLRPRRDGTWLPLTDDTPLGAEDREALCDTKSMLGLLENGLVVRGEAFREYVLPGHTYRIERPVRVRPAKGFGFHHVQDQDGITHLVPAPGRGGCVLRIGPTTQGEPVPVGPAAADKPVGADPCA